MLALRDEILADSEQAKEEEGPDLKGLKEDIYDRLDEGNQIYAPELAHTYSVPVHDVEGMIEEARRDVDLETAEKRKKALMNEYDDLSSEVQHLWGTHLKRSISWDGLFTAAQAHWMSLEDSHNYSPADESEESLKLQIGIWKNFKEDLEYTVRVIHHQGSERGEIWLLKRLVIKPKQEEQHTELQIQPLSDPEPKEEEGTDLPDKPTEEEDDRKARRKAYDQYVKASDHVFHRWGNVKFFEWQTFRKAMLTAYPDLNERVVSGHAGDKLSVKDLNLQTQIWKDVNADIDDAENGEGNWVGVLSIQEEQHTELQIQPLSDPEPKEGKPQEPTWIQIIVHGQHHTGEVNRHEFRVDTPMADEYMVLIGNAAMEAAKEAYTRISAERTEEEA